MTNKKGILLLNLGGPEKIEDIQPFLYNLFSDRQIIRLGPAFLQKPIATWIAKKRAPKSAENYRRIGGGSPLKKITCQQAQALEQALAKHGDYLVRVGMRYWHPFTQKAIDELISEGVEEIIALPLYPHYSIATTGSSFTDLEKIVKKNKIKIPVKKIHSWPTQSSYIESVAEKIQQGLGKFKGDSVQILYSAHSLPVKFIDEGDPYVEEIQATIEALERLTDHKGVLCYQSRSGPVDWLGPSTPETITDLAEKECKNILVVPISFVSDHVETLYELDIEYREIAEAQGIGYEVAKGLNQSPLFIRGLKELVLESGS